MLVPDEGAVEEFVAAAADPGAGSDNRAWAGRGNADPMPFNWTETAEEILATVTGQPIRDRSIG
jgi:hypothetical protein